MYTRRNLAKLLPAIIATPIALQSAPSTPTNEIIDYYKLSHGKYGRSCATDFLDFLKDHILKDTSYEKNDENIKKILELQYFLSKRLRATYMGPALSGKAVERQLIQLIIKILKANTSGLTCGSEDRKMHELLINTIRLNCKAEIDKLA